MKKTLAIIGVALLTAVATVQAQSTNGLFGDIGSVLGDVGLSASPTNYAVAPFVGWGAGGKLSAGALVIENVNSSGTVGIVGGYDHLWFGGKQGSANLVSGGLTLKAPFQPFKVVCNAFHIPLGTNTWLYNETWMPYGLLLAGTPVNGTSNDGGLCSIERGGLNMDIYNFKGWKLGFAFDLGTRQGAGLYNGNWKDAALTLRWGF